MKKLINFFKDEEGATMVEYGLMVALIAVVCHRSRCMLGTNLSMLSSTHVAGHSRLGIRVITTLKENEK